MSNDSSNSAQAATTETPKSHRWVWSPSTAVLIVVLSYFAAQFLGGIIVSIYPYLRNWDSTQANNWLTNSVLAQFFYVLLSEAITLTVVWLFVRHRIALKLLGLVRPHWRDILYAIGGVLVYFLLYSVAVGIISSLVSINVNQQQDVGFQNVVGVSALVLTFASLVILPPIAEEITFRGFLYGGFRRRFNPLWAALGTSLLFAAPHLLESDSGQGLLWIAGIDTFVLSLVLCYLREKTGSLWASMGVHAAKNSIAFISLFIVHVH
jgi:membrane protease YdiL (CAAX protease family)